MKKILLAVGVLGTLMTSTFTSTNGLIATSFRRDDASNHIVRMPHLRRAWNIRSARPNVNFALNEEERHQRDMALALRYRNRGNQAGIRALANQLERLNLNRAVPEPARGHFIMARRFMQPGEQSPLPGRVGQGRPSQESTGSSVETRATPTSSRRSARG